MGMVVDGSTVGEEGASDEDRVGARNAVKGKPTMESVSVRRAPRRGEPPKRGSPGRGRRGEDRPSRRRDHEVVEGEGDRRVTKLVSARTAPKGEENHEAAADEDEEAVVEARLGDAERRKGGGNHEAAEGGGEDAVPLTMMHAPVMPTVLRVKISKAAAAAKPPTGRQGEGRQEEVVKANGRGHRR